MCLGAVVGLPEMEFAGSVVVLPLVLLGVVVEPSGPGLLVLPVPVGGLYEPALRVDLAGGRASLAVNILRGNCKAFFLWYIFGTRMSE